MTESAKYCINCRYCTAANSRHVQALDEPRCMRVADRRDIVTGRFLAHCSDERGEFSSCGPEGKLWEEFQPYVFIREPPKVSLWKRFLLWLDAA